jgi:hypothetical protein
LLAQALKTRDKTGFFQLGDEARIHELFGFVFPHIRPLGGVFTHSSQVYRPSTLPLFEKGARGDLREPKGNERIAAQVNDFYLSADSRLLVLESVQPRRILPHQFAQARLTQVFAPGHRFHSVGKLAVAVIVVRREDKAIFTDEFHDKR